MSKAYPLIANELDVLAALWHRPEGRVVELGCGNARMARHMVQRWPWLSYEGLEVDARQHALNQANAQPGLSFRMGGAQAIPGEVAGCDLVLMLKSLHHVPPDEMDVALAEVARVLKPGGFFYVSEPVYAGPLNDIVRLFNDEQTVRAQAQAALDRALCVPASPWLQLEVLYFDMPVHFADFAQFEQRMLRPSFAEHCTDPALVQRVSELFSRHMGPEGAHFVRPMHVRWWQRAL